MKRASKASGEDAERRHASDAVRVLSATATANYIRNELQATIPYSLPLIHAWAVLIVVHVVDCSIGLMRTAVG
jgi:hypothetical protein